MTQDYAKPSTTRKKGKAKAQVKPGTTGRAKTKTRARTPKQVTPPPRRGKSIVSLVLLLGAFAYALYYLQSIPPTVSTPTVQKKQQIDLSNTVQKPPKTPTKAADQRFKFYDILPESEVIPPKVDAYQYKEKTQSDQYYYLVQTGSFRQIQDAERQKATIAFQGIKANIKTVQSSNGSVWHRVMTGPFYDRSQMNSALDKLVAINIEPLVKKIKNKK